MSGPIVRTGATPKFWENYDNIFGGKKKSKKKSTADESGAKKKSAKKSTKKQENNRVPVVWRGFLNRLNCEGPSVNPGYPHVPATSSLLRVDKFIFLMQ